MSQAVDDLAPEPGSAAWWAAHADRLARRRPRTGGLTIERIVDTAVAIIDAEGLDALTVRNLAARFETSSATLYRHVASVEELRVLVVDHVLGEVRIPGDSVSAAERVVALGLELRRVLLAHPGVVPALPAAPLLGPNAQRGAEAGFASLLALGLPEEEAVPAYLALIDFVLGSVFFDSASGVHGRTLGIDGDDVVASGLHTFLHGLARAD
ncbi:TetR/AcrR family transcriptional regulator [Actinomarinicola tropica]|nr:TetR/AcrR family transcriptional regulator [Actinomarinicola tropica]